MYVSSLIILEEKKAGVVLPDWLQPIVAAKV